ncbi:MAG: penicillin acylase family protein, partial [Paracoccaceae bacterium]
MAFLFKWLWRLIMVAVLGFAAGFALLYYFASTSLPDYNRSLAVNGLSGPVEIVRDNHAIPHVFAEDDNDALFGLGFVHAQDRLWQMMLSRRIAQGRLAEIFGTDGLNLDEFMRSLDIYTVAQQAVRHQTPETMAALRAYSAGVNAWLETVRKEALGRGAPEFFMFSKEISPWTPADSIVIAKLLALQLTEKAQK